MRYETEQPGAASYERTFTIACLLAETLKGQTMQRMKRTPVLITPVI
jgi:hypothetical protein